MYIWTALYIEDNLEELRDQSIRIGEDLGVENWDSIIPLISIPLTQIVQLLVNGIIPGIRFLSQEVFKK